MGLVRALAEFEKLPGPPADADARFAQHFAERRFSLLVADDADDADTLVGYALYFFTYSTFVVGPSLYLEDLFVLPEVRGDGLGRRFMQALAQAAVERGCERFEWCVLDWNVRAQKFYRSLGADIHEDWQLCRMTGDAITQLARGR